MKLTEILINVQEKCATLEKENQELKMEIKKLRELKTKRA